MKLKLVLICTALWSSAVVAAPPSDESAERLLDVLQTAKQLEEKLANLDGLNRRGFSEKLGGGKPLNPDQQNAVEHAVAKASEIMRHELEWSRVKPGLIRIIQETFDQEELDGILSFYATRAGRALLAKFPSVEQRSARHVLSLGSAASQKVQAAVERDLDAVKSAK